MEMIADLAQADAVLAELCGIDQRLKQIEVAMNTVLDAAKAEAKAKAAPLAARKKTLEAGLAAFSAYNRAELFGKRKSLDRAHGSFGFRLCSKLKTSTRITWEMVLQKLKDYGFKDGIRIKEEVDRDALRSWPKERQELVGVFLDSDDEFFVEVRQEKLKEEAA